MKKKILTLFLAFICALCFAFGFTACDEGDDGNTDSGTTNSPAENTEERAWQTALNNFRQKKNFTLSLTAKSDKTLVKTIKLDGLTYYEKVGNQEHFLSSEGIAFYDYTYTNGKGWVKTACFDYYAYVNSNIDIVGWAALAFSNSYSSFKRSGEKYSAESIQVDDNTNLADIEVTLNGNSVNKVEFVWVEEDKRLTITDIGTSQIKLPSDYVDETSNAKVSAKEWETALDISSFVNFTAEAWYGNEQFVLIADLDKNVYYYRDNFSTENYYSIENETCYNYKKEEKEELYTRTEKDLEYFSEQFTLLQPMFVLSFKGSYSKFTYDERSGTYRADKVTVDGVTYSADFRFEKGKLKEAFIMDGEYLTVIFFDYGSTEVTLPEVFSEGSDIENVNEGNII